jgi:hypothetical protein
MNGTNRPKIPTRDGREIIGEFGPDPIGAEGRRRRAIEEALERMLFEEREEEGKWLREKGVLQRYKDAFTKGWLRHSRRLMRSGINPTAGPNFSSVGRLVWYEVAEIEKWLRSHRFGGTSAK